MSTPHLSCCNKLVLGKKYINLSFQIQCFYLSLYRSYIIYFIYKSGDDDTATLKKATENDTNGKRHETENSMKRKAKNGITKF